MTADGTPAQDGSQLDEFGLIERYFKPLATVPGAFQLIDDAAAFAPPAGKDLVLTKDGIAEGIHFLPGETADAVARKALRVNLSDLAAKGAVPVGYLLLLGLAGNWEEEWIAQFAAGLRADQSAYGAILYGGDTIRANGLVVSITAFGTVDAGGMVRRTGANVGDKIYVSGTIGDGALGLLVATDDNRVRALDTASRDYLHDRYRLPQPRVALAPVLAKYATAALDVSDGLAGDLDKLCKASGVTARVSVDAVPLSPAARAAVGADSSLLPIGLSGGDDYEIVCTVRPEYGSAFETAARAAGVAVAQIGDIAADGSEAVFVDHDGRPVAFTERSFSHVHRTYSPS